MSDTLKIALVAEGPTDLEVIQAALKDVLPNPFIMTLLKLMIRFNLTINRFYRTQSISVKS